MRQASSAHPLCFAKPPSTGTSDALLYRASCPTVSLTFPSLWGCQPLVPRTPTSLAPSLLDFLDLASSYPLLIDWYQNCFLGVDQWPSLITPGYFFSFSRTSLGPHSGTLSTGWGEASWNLSFWPHIPPPPRIFPPTRLLPPGSGELQCRLLLLPESGHLAIHPKVTSLASLFCFVSPRVPAWGLCSCAALSLPQMSQAMQSCWGFGHPIHCADAAFPSHNHPLWSRPRSHHHSTLAA